MVLPEDSHSVDSGPVLPVMQEWGPGCGEVHMSQVPWRQKSPGLSRWAKGAPSPCPLSAGQSRFLGLGEIREQFWLQLPEAASEMPLF